MGLLRPKHLPPLRSKPLPLLKPLLRPKRSKPSLNAEGDKLPLTPKSWRLPLPLPFPPSPLLWDMLVWDMLVWDMLVWDMLVSPLVWLMVLVPLPTPMFSLLVVPSVPILMPPTGSLAHTPAHTAHTPAHTPDTPMLPPLLPPPRLSDQNPPSLTPSSTPSS